jgi:hypothetical protein
MIYICERQIFFYAAVGVAGKLLCAGFTNCCTLDFFCSFVGLFASSTGSLRKTQQRPFKDLGRPVRAKTMVYFFWRKPATADK